MNLRPAIFAALVVMNFIAEFGEERGVEMFKQHVAELKMALEALRGGDLD